MKALTTLCLLAFLTSYSFCQEEESLFATMFVAPVEDLMIEDMDSVILVDNPLLIDGYTEQYDYTLFVAGFDTLEVSTFDVLFAYNGITQLSETYSMSEIDSDENLQRIEDTVFLPVTQQEYLANYTFTLTLKDSDDNVISSFSDAYSEGGE